MLKKLSIILLFIIILVIILIKFQENNRISYILTNAIGSDEYLSKIDEKIFTGIGGADETYIYKIMDTKQINCNLLKKYKKIEFPDFSEKKYINSNQPICEYVIPDKFNRYITVIIQNEILILELVY